MDDLVASINTYIRTLVSEESFVGMNDLFLLDDNAYQI